MRIIKLKTNKTYRGNKKMNFNIGKTAKKGLATLALMAGMYGGLDAQDIKSVPDSTQTTQKTYTLCLPGAVKTTTTPKVDTTYVINKGDKFIHTEKGSYQIETEIDKNKLTAKESEDNKFTEAYTAPLQKEISSKDSTITDLKKLNNYFANGAVNLKLGLSGDWNNFSPVVGLGYDFWIPAFQENENVSLYVGINGYAFAPKHETVEMGDAHLVDEVVNLMPGSGMHRVAEFWEKDITTTTQQQYADILLKGKFVLGDYNLSAGAGVSISKIAKPVTTEGTKTNYLVNDATGNSIPTGNPVALEPVTVNDNSWFVPTGVSLEALVGKKDSKLSTGVYTSNQNFGLGNKKGLGHTGLVFQYKF
jgi:hypothetical protein